MRKFGYLLSAMLLCGGCLFGCDISAEEINQIVDNIDNIKIVINEDDEKINNDEQEDVEEREEEENEINNNEQDEEIELENEEDSYTDEEQEDDFNYEQYDDESDEDYTYEEPEDEYEYDDGVSEDEEEYAYEEQEPSHRDLYGSYQVYPIGNTVLWDDPYTWATLTFYDPATGKWGGVGHNAELYGSITDALVREVSVIDYQIPDESMDRRQDIISVDRGSVTYGTTTQIGDFGVYGDYDASQGGYVSQIYEVGWKDEVHTGAAQIISEVPNMDNDALYIYTIEITGVYNDHFDFVIVDEHMLADGFGIAGGMSGTPILQDNHIIGALYGNHPTENDIETFGSGTYIEDMLIESGIIEQQY